MTLLRRLVLALALIAGSGPAFAQAPAPVPALPDAERRTSYYITGSKCQCAVGFALFGDSTDYQNWLEVWVNGQMIPQSGNWTLTSPSGPLSNLARPITDAVLTFTAAQTGTVQIVGARRPRRTSQFSESRGVAARDLNQVITDIVAQNRETWDKINDVSGRTMLAPPGETLGILPPAASRAGMGICFDSSGKLAPCVAIPSSTIAAGNGIQLTGTSPTVISSTIPASAPIVTRAAAQALDLSAYTAIRTQGYSVGGDGGHATFKNVGAAPFIDSFVSGFTITGGSGYTSGGPFYGVLFTNGTKPYVIGTVTVLAGIVTGVNISGSPGNQCAVGDVYALTGSAAATAAPASGLPAGGSGASITVTSCSTPLASFTDAAGNHWQFIPDGLGSSALQFGAKGDWNGTDGAATDNYNAIQACMWTAGFKNSTSIGGGGFWGGQCQVPQGTFMACGTGLKPLIVPQGVVLQGASNQGSVIQFCTAWNGSVINVELGDPNWHFACFSTIASRIQFRSSSGAGYVVHSDCLQDFGGLYDVYIYANAASARGCVHFEKSFGGGSQIVLRNVSCGANSPAPQIWMGNLDATGLNFGTTMIEMTGIVMGANSSGLPVQSGPGIRIDGGWITGSGAHCESMPQCLLINITPTANGFVTWNNMNAGNGNGSVTCTGVVQFGSINSTIGNNSLSMIQQPGSCAHTVDNGMTSGVPWNTPISTPMCFKPNSDRAGCP